jgi:hypothetical protein
MENQKIITNVEILAIASNNVWDEAIEKMDQNLDENAIAEFIDEKDKSVRRKDICDNSQSS